MDNLSGNALSGRKLEVDVQLSDEHYIVVSSFINGQSFHGILLKNQNSDCGGVQKVPFGINDDRFDDWKNFAANNFQTNDSLWSDSDKISSLYLRQTNLDKSKLISFRNSDVFSRHAQGIRRLESRPVRLRPVAGQRNTVLCAKCQLQRVAAPLPRNARFTLAGASSSSSSSSRPQKRGYRNSSNCAEVGVRKREYACITDDAKRSDNKMSKTNAQILVQQLAVNKRQMLGLKKSGTPVTLNVGVSGSNSVDDSIVSAFVSGGPKNFHTTVGTPPPPPPPPAPLRVPTLKITFGKSDAKTVTVINGRRSIDDSSSSSTTPTPTKHWKKALMLQESESASASASFTTNSSANLQIDNSKRCGGSSSEDTMCQSYSSSTNVVEPANQICDGTAMAALLPHGLKLNDVVWAKMRSYPYWPAQIYDVQDRQACVTWCGSTQYGYVDISVLEPFVANFNKRYNAKRPTAYQKAVADAVCHFSDVFQNAYYVSLLSPMCRKLVAKQQQQEQRKRQRTEKQVMPQQASSSSSLSSSSSSSSSDKGINDVLSTAGQADKSGDDSPSSGHSKSNEIKNSPPSSTPKHELIRDLQKSKHESNKDIVNVIDIKSKIGTNLNTKSKHETGHRTKLAAILNPKVKRETGQNNNVPTLHTKTKHESGGQNTNVANLHMKSNKHESGQNTKLAGQMKSKRDNTYQTIINLFNPNIKPKHETDSRSNAMKAAVSSTINPNTKSKYGTGHNTKKVAGPTNLNVNFKHDTTTKQNMKSYKIPLRPAVSSFVPVVAPSIPAAAAAAIDSHPAHAPVDKKLPTTINRSCSSVTVFESDSESDDDRLVIDEMAEESFETFEKRRRLNSSLDEDESAAASALPDVAKQPPLPAHHVSRGGGGGGGGGGNSNLPPSSTTAPGKAPGGGDVDFDSVLSELQEMNDMCAAGSTNSLLTTC